MNKGYHLFTDNFYRNTIIHIKQKQYVEIEKLVPKEAKTVPVNEQKYFTNDLVLMCSFRDKSKKKKKKSGYFDFYAQQCGKFNCHKKEKLRIHKK